MVQSPCPQLSQQRPTTASRTPGGHNVSNEPLLLCATGSPSQQKPPDAEPAVCTSLTACLSILDPSQFLCGRKKTYLGPGPFIPRALDNNIIS